MLSFHIKKRQLRGVQAKLKRTGRPAIATQAQCLTTDFPVVLISFEGSLTIFIYSECRTYTRNPSDNSLWFPQVMLLSEEGFKQVVCENVYCLSPT